MNPTWQISIQNTSDHTISLTYRANMVGGGAEDLMANQPLMRFPPKQTVKIDLSKWNAADGPLAQRYLKNGKLKVIKPKAAKKETSTKNASS